MSRSANQMTKSGFCGHPSPGSHAMCRSLPLTCDCTCHTDPDSVIELEPWTDEPADDDEENERT